MTFCPRCGARLVTREAAGRPRLVCPACGFVLYNNPLPVAACVAEAAGGLYLIRRRFEPGKDRWGLPAGFIEYDEGPIAAAARETLEETGLIVAIGALIGIYPYVEQTGTRGGLVIAYHGRVTGGQAVAGDDAAEVRLFSIDALPTDLAFDTHRAALRDWLTGRGLPIPPGLTPA